MTSSLSSEQAAKVAELLALREAIWEFEDDEEGPWSYADGRPYPIARYPRPPERHPRRCHAPSIGQGGHRCRRWSEPGRRNCRFHGGTRPLMYRDDTLPAAYRKLLRPTLAARLDEFVNNPRREEALELYDEIGLARSYLSERIELHEKLKAVNEAEPGKVPGEVLVASEHLVMDGLNHVADLAKKMAGIQKDLSDGLTAGHLGMFIEQVTRVIHKTFGDDPRIPQVVEALREDVLLPREDPRVPLEIVVKYDD